MSQVDEKLLEGGAVLQLTFEGEKGNILTGAVMEKLDQALARHASSAPLKLVLVQGAGKHFSFGASVEEHQRDQAAKMLATFHALLRRLARYPVPVAAVVKGRCLGGAFEVALGCNFVFAEPKAVFACPEIKLGVFPPVLAALGPDRLGTPWTERLVLTGADLPAATAHSLGFVTELAEEGKEPLEQALAFYRRELAPLSAYSLRQALEAVRMGAKTAEKIGAALTDIERHYLQTLLPSHDGNEGITAFLAKRPPQWKHE